MVHDFGRVNLRTTIDPPAVSTTSDHNTIPNKLGRSAQIVVRVIDTKSQPILRARVSRSHLDRSVSFQANRLDSSRFTGFAMSSERQISQGKFRIRIDRDHMNSIRINHPQYLVGNSFSNGIRLKIP